MFTPARLIAATLGLALATPAVAAPTMERPPSSMTSCATTDWSCLGPYRSAPLPYGVPSTTTYRPYRIKLPSSTFHPDKAWTWPTGDTAVYANMTEGLVGEDVNDTRNLNLKGPFDLLHVEWGGVNYLYVYTELVGFDYIYTLVVEDVPAGMTAGAILDVDGDGEPDVLAGYGTSWGGAGLILSYVDVDSSVLDSGDWDGVILGVTGAKTGLEMAGWSGPEVRTNYGTPFSTARVISATDYVSGMHYITTYPYESGFWWSTVYYP